MLNLMHFKLVKEDKDNFHVEHPSGKTLVVAKNLLSDKAHKAIRKFSDGGGVESTLNQAGADFDKTKYGSGKVEQASTSDAWTKSGEASGGQSPTKAERRQQAGYNSQSSSNQVASYQAGGKIPHYDEGTGNVEPKDKSLMERAGSALKEGFLKSPLGEALQIGQSAIPAVQQGVSDFTKGLGVQEQPEPQAQPAPQAAPNQAPQIENAPQQAVNPLAQAYGQSQQILENQIKSAQDAQKAVESAGAMQGSAYADQVKQMSQMRSANDIFQDHQLYDHNYMNDIKDIDPNKWKTEHLGSTGSKVMAAIAMAISGAGAGRNGTNLAYETIKNAIGQDIDAQKANQGKAVTLWKMNHDMYQDEQQANLTTQNQMLTQAQARIAQAGNQIQNAQARLSMANLVAQLQQQKVDNNKMQALMGSQGGGKNISADPALLIPPNAPPQEKEKALGEIEAAQNTASNSDKILRAFDNAATRVHAADFVPGIDNADQMQLHALLGPTFKDVEGTVRQAAMDNMFKNTTPQVFDGSDKIAKKREALKGYLESKSAAPNFKNLTGLDLAGFQSTSQTPGARLNPQVQKYYDFAKANPNLPVSKDFFAKHPELK